MDEYNPHDKMKTLYRHEARNKNCNFYFPVLHRIAKDCFPISFPVTNRKSINVQSASGGGILFSQRILRWRSKMLHIRYSILKTFVKQRRSGHEFDAASFSKREEILHHRWPGLPY